MKNQITLGTWPGTAPTTKNEADTQAITVVLIAAMSMYTAHFFARKYDEDRDYETDRRFLSPAKEYTFIPSIGRNGMQRRNNRSDLLFKTVPGFEEVTQEKRDLYLRKRAELLEKEANDRRRTRAESGGYR